MSTHYICSTEADAQRLILAIDAVRVPDGTETVEIVERGEVVRRETRPAKPWDVPMPLRDGTWAVPMPDGKAERVFADLPPTREVDVPRRPEEPPGPPVRVRVPPLSERVAVRDEAEGPREPEDGR